MIRNRLWYFLPPAFMALVSCSPAGNIQALNDDAVQWTARDGGNIILAAGDVAECGREGAEKTAQILDRTSGTILILGDLAYESGTLWEFQNCFDPTWGRHKQRSRPAPGNHEYLTPGAEGYFTYWGDLAGPPARAYYSFDLADWHIIALNSVIDSSVGSQQYLWLRQDLSQTKSRCILAYWHHPLFLSNSKIRRDDTTLALYEALYESGASVVLAGHTHRYERFAPLDPEGMLDEARGIRSFIVGTGGATLYRAKRVHPHTEYIDHEHWGVLRLTLDQGRYEWEFLTSDGRVTDRGSAPCVDRSAN